VVFRYPPFLEITMSVNSATPTGSAGPTFTGVGPTVSNIVSGVHLNCRFDLKHLARSARNAIYNPKRFPACIIRIREPKATVLVFEQGKMQVLGTKSVDDARLAARKFARMLQKLGYQPRLSGFEVQNMVGNADTKLVIRLEGLRAAHFQFTVYEPEIFPGLIYSISRPAPLRPLKLLIFTKGKIVFLGARKKEDMDDALRKIWPVLLQFRRE